MKFRIFVENVDKGTDGEWFDLPVAEDEIGLKICETLGQSPVNGYLVSKVECEVRGWELRYEVDEQSIYEINEDAIALSEREYAFTDDMCVIVNFLIESKGEDLQDALDEMDTYRVYDDCSDEEDLGKAIADEEGLSYDSDLEDYINWSDFVGDRLYDYDFDNGFAIVKEQ